MESDLQLPNHFFQDHHQQQYLPYQQKQLHSGLTRYQSAPNSYFSSFLNQEFYEEFLNRPSSPETEWIFSRYLANNTENSSKQNLCTTKHDSLMRESTPLVTQQEQTMASIYDTVTEFQLQHQQMNYKCDSQNSYMNHSRPPFPDQSSKSMERSPQMKLRGAANYSGLVRRTISPAGLFTNIGTEFENGYAALRGMGNLGTGNEETSFSATSKPPAYLGQITIAGIENKNMGVNKLESSGFGEAHSNKHVTGFPLGSWNDTATMSDSTKGCADDDKNLSNVNASETQNLEAANGPPVLAHHLSLPKTSTDMFAIDKYLQLQDSVKIRAKRGCATHPRSIAERVRRTKISERMRKLQDLVPSMDKQTNTSEMLDLAVDYIKDLEMQVKVLPENSAKCACTSKQQSCPKCRPIDLVICTINENLQSKK